MTGLAACLAALAIGWGLQPIIWPIHVVVIWSQRDCQDEWQHMLGGLVASTDHVEEVHDELEEAS